MSAYAGCAGTSRSAQRANAAAAEMANALRRSRLERPHGYIASSEPPRETTVTTVEAGSSSVKVVDATFPA